MLQIIQNRRWAYIFSSLLIVGSLVSLIMWGLKFGIDFTGGTIMEVEFKNSRPEITKIEQSLTSIINSNSVVQPVGNSGIILRFKEIDQATHENIIKMLNEAGGGEVSEKRYGSVGPTIGTELQRRALWAIVVALFFIVSYIGWAFRKVSYPVSSWKYGLAAIIALAHDVLITIGVFSALGHFMGVEVDALFVSALLTVLGFSVHDTIVVFDRTRENLFRGNVAGDFENTVNKSVNDTLARSINTSLTTLLVLCAMFIFGGPTIHYFTLALIVGITIGTYSSIFVASPLLVDWYKAGLKARK